jgi:very-short-patch-repair endonuclease
VTTIDGIPVTRVARTLIDLAACMPADRLEDAVDDALCRRLVTFGRLTARNDSLARQGRPSLAPVLTAWVAPGRIPDSVAEMRLVRRLLAHGLPQPERQVAIAGIGRVDLLYRLARVVIELESFRWHGARRGHERTKQRRNQLTAAGYKVIQATVADLKGDGHRLCRQVAALVEAGPQQ